MAASQRDLELAAFLVPLTDEVEHLVCALQHLCSDLGTGHASGEQRQVVARRILDAVAHLTYLRGQLIPVTSLQWDMRDASRPPGERHGL